MNRLDPPFKNDKEKSAQCKKDCRFSSKMSEFTQQFGQVVRNPLLRENGCGDFSQIWPQLSYFGYLGCQVNHYGKIKYTMEISFMVICVTHV